MGLVRQGIRSLGLNEDDPTVTAVAIMVADEHDGTYKIPSR
jgi:hypothetical protein